MPNDQMIPFCPSNRTQILCILPSNENTNWFSSIWSWLSKRRATMFYGFVSGFLLAWHFGNRGDPKITSFFSYASQCNNNVMMSIRAHGYNLSDNAIEKITESTKKILKL